MPVDRNAKPPAVEANGDVNTSKINENAGVSGGAQSEGGDSRSESARPLPGTPAAGPQPSQQPSNGTEHRRYRGRRRIRTRAQVRARLDELAGKLERNAIDPKTAAIIVQALHGVLACLNAEHDEDFDKRLAALEAKQGGPKKRGSDA